MPFLTVVVGFCDRDLQRVERCLQSLDRQTFRDFELIFVDYGSQTPTARAAQQLTEQFIFARYIYSDTRGYPWNRSRALNIGAKLAQSEYILTTDVDMVFSSDFLRVAMESAGGQKVLYCAPYFLERNFQDWDHVESYAGKYPIGEAYHKGGCQVIPTKIFHQLQGFDETYQYWGTEDRDIYHRLLALGFDGVWLNDRTSLFHQWHPQANVRTANFMPDASWRRAQMYFYKHFSETIRNQYGWGNISLTSERRILEFVDLDVPCILEHPSLTFFDESPYLDGSVIKFIDCFLELPKDHAVAVNHAFFPAVPRGAGMLLEGINKILELIGGKTRVNWQVNTLHAFLAEFIEQNPDQVADYYLRLPVKNGVSIIMKK